MGRLPLILLSLLAIVALAGNEAPSMGTIADQTFREDQDNATITVTGISAGPPAEAGQTVEIHAGSADTGLLGIQGIVFDPATGTAVITLELVYDQFGTTLVYVSALDSAGALTLRSCRVTITPQPDLPLLIIPGFFISPGQTITLDDNDFVIRDEDNPPDDTLVMSVTAVASVGDFLLDGSIVLGVGDTVTKADLVARRLSFRHNGGATATQDTASFSITDGIFPAWFDRFMYIYVQNSLRPVVTLPGPAAQWSEGAGGIVVCPAATVSDPDTMTYATLTMVISSDPDSASPGDVLYLRGEGTGAGQTAVEGSAIFFGGLPVGTWAGGQGLTPLVVTFSGHHAGPEAVQSMLRCLRFDHPDHDPGAATRLIQVVLNDNAAGPADAATAQIQLNLVDDPPQITSSGIGTLAGVARTLALTVADLDSTVFTWSVTSQPALARIDLVDAATGRITVTPAAGWSGSDAFTVAVSDGVNPPSAATISLRITDPDDPRPQALADAPFEVQAGDVLVIDIPWDAEVDIGSTGDVPTDLTLTPLSTRVVRLVWAVPLAEPEGLHRFSILATDRATLATGRLPVLLHSRPRVVGID